MAEKKPTARELRTRKASPLVLEWGKTLTNQNAWPEGKSIAGFEKWLRSQFYQAAKEARATGQKLNIPHDAGHASIGADVLSNLAPQIRFGKDSNQTTIDKTTGQQISSNLEHVRLRKDLMDVDADFALSQAFEQYLNIGEIEPGSQLNLADFAAEYRTKILHDADYAPTALAAESRAQLERLEEAYKEQAGFFPEPEITDAVDKSGPVKVVQEGDPRRTATVISPADPPDNPYPSKRKVPTTLARQGGMIKYLPLVPLGIGLTTAAGQAKAGEYDAAAGTLIETGVGELPFGDFVVDAAAGLPVAEGTLSERARQVYEEDKSKLPVNVPVTNPTDPFAQAPSYVKPDYSNVGKQKP